MDDRLSRRRQWNLKAMCLRWPGTWNNTARHFVHTNPIARCSQEDLEAEHS